MRDFKYIDLFSGIGGFRQALDSLGGTCVMASEIDKFAEQAYQAIYGHTTVGDITKVKAEDVPDHDVLVGGFPCQSFSVAGKRKGFEDTRGTMFFEIARIASVKKPKILLLENVKGLVNHDKGRTLDTMIESLNEIGYIVDFNVLNSKFFGVPQNRERVFIVAVREDLIESEPFSEESMKGNTIVPKRKRQINEWAETFNFDWPQNDEVTTKLRDILEREVDEKYYLSDDKTARLIAQLEANPSEDDIPLENTGRLAGLRNRTDRVFAYQGDKKRSTAQENIYLRDEAIADSVTVGHMPKYINSEPQMLGHLDMKGNDQIKRVYSTESVGPTLTTMGGGNTEPKIAESQVPHWIPKPDEINRTVRSSGKSSLTEKHNHDYIAENIRLGYRIRKLTPLECFRLQGFSDEVHQTLVDEGISDSQRYKMAGNAVTVNVIDAVGEKLITYL